MTTSISSEAKNIDGYREKKLTIEQCHKRTLNYHETFKLRKLKKLEINLTLPLTEKS